MAEFLLDRPVAHHSPGHPKWYDTRRLPILAIVVHITAGLEDLDATDDQSAEATARYAATTDRQVSWHSGSDTDSDLDLLPDSYTAFHVRGYNSCTLGHEISKRHTDWRRMPKVWRDRTLDHAARRLAAKADRHGIPFRVATRAELDAAIAHYRRTGEVRPVGFIGHWVLDPGRRSDPGYVPAERVDTFPWHEFLELARHHSNEEDDMTPDDRQKLDRLLAVVEHQLPELRAAVDTHNRRLDGRLDDIETTLAEVGRRQVPESTMDQTIRNVKRIGHKLRIASIEGGNPDEDG